jgi:PPM family protein phosphatase
MNVQLHPVVYLGMPISSTMSEIESSSVTHIGLVRDENQDAVRLCDVTAKTAITQGYLYGIADGMGGYSHGSVASTLALTSFFETFYQSDEKTIAAKLRQGIRIANLEVLQKASKIGAVRMGTTLTVAHILGNQMTLAHVGDSRAYLIRKRKALCLTNDHSKVGELVRMKLIAPEKLRSHYQRSVITRSIGFDLFVQPDIETVGIQSGDTIVLCTDGVWCMVEDDELASMSESERESSALANNIIECALARQSDDNVSVVVLKIQNVVSNPQTEVRNRWNFLKFLRRQKRIEPT